MLKFNSNGLLIPATIIKSTVQELEQVFVISPDQKRRADIWRKYIIYSNALKDTLSNIALLQWIDGSFVTMKPEPNDIDLVTFISSSAIEALGSKIDAFKYPASVELFGVDAYIVKIYNADDKKHPVYLSDQKYWMHNFDKARMNRKGQKLQKGFLEIIY